jgi:nucleoside-diphosphate-sugar epimerase
VSIRGHTISPRIAITGGLGCVGSALATYLRAEFNVRVLDSRNGLTKDDNVEIVKCDITDYTAVEHALQDIDLVIHTAIVQIPQINEDKRRGYEVNVIGTQNVCEAVRNSPLPKGLILTGSWHTFGEKNITGHVDEGFGFRPDMVEARARCYALSKVAQETIVRLHEEASGDKKYGIIRIGTVLGENMPKLTAANIFIDNAIRGEPLAPYEHSMYRPMLYVDIADVCRAFHSYAQKILQGGTRKTGDSLHSIVNVFYPEPITILELAGIVKDCVTECSAGRIRPEVVTRKTGQNSPYTPNDKELMRVDVSKAKEFLGIEALTHPRAVIDRIVRSRISMRETAI